MTRSRRYHYTECGLDNVYLVSGFEYVDTPRGRAVRIRDIDGLHRAIGRTLVREKKDLNGKEFRFLRHELNMTQQHLASLLGVDVQTIARWEKGKTQITGPAQALVRLLYEEHTHGRRKIIEPLTRIAELDEPSNGKNEPLAFEDTEEGWLPSLEAA
jgi:DNA-binding transcriptional regulator YiaG